MRLIHLPSLIAIAATLSVPAALAAPVCRGDDPMYRADLDYDPAVPTPAAFLGHRLGDEPVHPYRVVEYLRRLADLSDRITVETIGHSHERRPILNVTITSPGNHASLERIRREHLELTEPDRDREIDDTMPVVVWMNYGVHGSESSGMDAVLPVAYHLAAADDDAVGELLANSVIVVNPIANPDGHAQRVAWLEAYGQDLDRADPAHLEHRYSSVRTRTNHYGFDLNRQWLFATQPEARAWTGAWHRWRPNLTLDYHEMSSRRTYYFHPGIETRTNPLIPEEAERLMARTVERSEAFFDAERLLYFHGAGYDSFFIGKGSTFPMVNGGVGVLYEAGMSRGRFLETDNGCRSYRDNIRKHFRTGLASLESAVALKREYLEYQRRFYREALEQARNHPVGAYVVSAPGDPARLAAFADLLELHRIRAYSPARDIEADGRTWRAGASLVVPTAQSQFTLTRSIFETATTFEDPGFYDVSTWTLPPAYGLEVAALDRRDFDLDLVGEAYRRHEAPAPPVDGSAYAYVIEWRQYAAPHALYTLLARGLLAKVATEPFSSPTFAGPREFAPGSVIVSPEGQPFANGEIAALVNGLNAIEGIDIHALRSGRSVNGSSGVDLGAPSFRPLDLPEILLVVDSGISWYDAGEVWHLLDKRLRIPVTMMAKNRLDNVDLDRYTHIVFPGGRYSRSKKLTRLLEDWAERGGTLIGLRQGAHWLRKALLDGPDTDDDDESRDDAERLDYGSRQERAAMTRVSGAIFRADLDTSHPLGFGYTERTIAVHRNLTDVLARTDNRYATILEYTADPLVSGFASRENQDSIAGTPALIAERLDEGSVILFADNPNFRGYWYGTTKLFANALFFSRAFETPSDAAD